MNISAAHFSICSRANFCGIGRLTNGIQRYGVIASSAPNTGTEIAMAQLAGELETVGTKKIRNFQNKPSPQKNFTIPDVTKGKNSILLYPITILIILRLKARRALLLGMF